MELSVVVCVGLGAEGMVKSAYQSSSRSSVSSLSRPHQPPPGSELSRHQLPWMNAKPISPLSGCTGSAPCFSCSRVLNRVMLLLKLSSVSLSWCRCRSEEHTSELQSLMRISYAVFCLKKKKNKNT